MNKYDEILGEQAMSDNELTCLAAFVSDLAKSASPKVTLSKRSMNKLVRLVHELDAERKERRKAYETLAQREAEILKLRGLLGHAAWYVATVGTYDQDKQRFVAKVHYLGVKVVRPEIEKTA